MHPNVQHRGIGRYFFFLLWKSYCFIILFVIYVPASSLKIQVSIWMAQAFHLGVNTGICKSLCTLCVGASQIHTCSLHIPAALVWLGLFVSLGLARTSLQLTQPARYVQSMWPDVLGA